jgi:hypothetical protein
VKKIVYIIYEMTLVRFKSYLCSVARVRNASDTDISVIFPQVFFFVYRHSNLEGSCSNGTLIRHVNLVGACRPSRICGVR